MKNMIDVKKIAKLANLPITDSEEKHFASELADTLSYIENLKELNTDKVEGTYQVTSKESAFRDDIIDTSRLVPKKTYATKQIITN